MARRGRAGERPGGFGPRSLFIAIAALVFAGYAAYRAHRHFFSAAAVTPTEIPSQCVPRSTALHVPAHPVIAFGDSITNGLGASRRCLPLQPSDDSRKLHAANPNDSTYPDGVARLTGMQLLNYGYGGETTAQGRIRLRRVLALAQPRIVLLMEGTNDLLAKAPLRAIVNNLRAMVRESRGHGAQIILLTVIPLMPPQHGAWRQLDRDLRATARRDRVQLVTTTNLIRADYSPDGIHPNDRGYAIIARDVAAALGV